MSSKNNGDPTKDPGKPQGGANTTKLQTFTLVDQNGPVSSWQWSMGALVFGFFVVQWVASILSPLLFGLSLYFQNWIGVLLIIGVTILAYVPWYPNPHPVAEAIRHFFVHNTPFYFRSMKVISEGQPLPGQVDSPSTTTTKATNEPPTLLSVHPHGIFTLGWSMLYLRLR